MRGAMNRDGPVVAIKGRKQKRGLTTSCSVCTRRIWFDPIYLQEPEGIPVPRNFWVLCKECHGLLMTEFRRSPVRSPFRLRIAIGLVAASIHRFAVPRCACDLGISYSHGCIAMVDVGGKA